MEALIEKYALANAIKYAGKANAGNIIGQIIKEKPEVKKDMKTLQQLAAIIVEKVNRMSVDEQRANLTQLAPELLEKKEHKEHDLFAFLNIKEGSIVNTGWPPEPGKHLHIGHAKAAFINYELAKRYNGRFVLRFDDTNPEKPKAEFYDIIVKDLAWLGIKPDKVDVGSERLDELYPIADKLIQASYCFVCDCDPKLINDLRYNGQPCPHREQPVDETMRRWKSLKEGEVLRLRIDPAAKNTTMRDPTIFRVTHLPHARVGTKYHVWPTYDFETCLLDSIEHLTHRLRTKEFELRAELHNYIQRIAGFPLTIYYEFGRFAMEGVDTQGRVVREKIASGQYLGWDDPSLATIPALRRRGFTPEAIKSFVLATGITKNDAVTTWDDLYLHNRRVLNDTAKRLFFVENPQTIIVCGAPKKTVHLSYFPHEKKNNREFQTHEEFLVAEDDYFNLGEGKLFRLMDCVNFTRQGDAFVFHSEDIETYRANGSRIMHFLPKDHDAVHVSILMPDKEVKQGLGESRVKHLKLGDSIQFERFGFCRLDAITEGVYNFWYTHK